MAIENLIRQAAAGRLISCGTDLDRFHGRVAMQIERIVGGMQPGDIPVEQPTKTELVVSLAQVLGLSIPLPLLQRAYRAMR